MVTRVGPLEGGAGRRRGSQAGYNLVALMVIVAVVNIALAASLPLWSKAIERQKEDELIFRGLQYAEAIRVFQVRTGRFPTRLEELIEIEPRCIRQLWLDPMNEEPEWGLVLAQAAQAQLQGQQGQQLQPGGAPQRRLTRRQRREQERAAERGEEGETISPRQRIEDPGGGRRGVPRAGQQVTLGPIIGVHSLSTKSSTKVFEGGSNYNDWKFTTELLPKIELGATGENIPRLHSNWIGRPFPEGTDEALEGGLPTSPLDRKKDRGSKRRRNRNRNNNRDQ